MSSFARVGGPGTLGNIWEKLKEMRMVTGRKRKALESASSQEQSALTADGSGESNTSILRRQIDNIRLRSDSSTSSQGQSPVLASRHFLATGNVAGPSGRQYALRFDRSFAERQPLPDSDQSAPGLASTESSSESSSEEDNELALIARPWYRPEE